MSCDGITAVYCHPNSGYESDREERKKIGLVPGAEYDVGFISMGQSYTSVYIEEYGWFNSVAFDFYENGDVIDIYSDPRFNPYLPRR